MADYISRYETGAAVDAALDLAMSALQPESGKGLSTNDFTNEYKDKVDSNDSEISSARGSYTTVNDRLDAIESEQESQGEALDEDRAALVELVDGGAKNILKNTAPYGDNVRTNIIFSHNYDDSYIINAENSNTQNTDFYVATNVQLKPGTYKLSGCPAGGDNSSTYKLQIAGIGYDAGDGLTFTIVQATTLNVYIRIWAGYVPNGLVFKPMICCEATWDISHQYVPYRPSYDELIARIEALEAGT